MLGGLASKFLPSCQTNTPMSLRGALRTTTTLRALNPPTFNRTAQFSVMSSRNREPPTFFRLVLDQSGYPRRSEHTCRVLSKQSRRASRRQAMVGPTPPRSSSSSRTCPCRAPPSSKPRPRCRGGRRPKGITDNFQLGRPLFQFPTAYPFRTKSLPSFRLVI